MLDILLRHFWNSYRYFIVAPSSSSYLLPSVSSIDCICYSSLRLFFALSIACFAKYTVPCFLIASRHCCSRCCASKLSFSGLTLRYEEQDYWRTDYITWVSDADFSDKFCSFSELVLIEMIRLFIFCFGCWNWRHLQWWSGSCWSIECEDCIE